MVFSFTYRKKSDWKRFTQDFSKLFDSERTKQHQSVLSIENRRLPNEIIKNIKSIKN